MTVLGLGRFGGGLSVTQFLAERGAQLTVIDAKSEVELQSSIEQLRNYPGIRYELEGSSTDLAATDVLIANPAIPPHHPLLKEAEDRLIPVSSEIELFWQLNPARVIGVTGSNGKSTTTAMIHKICTGVGSKCWLGGNIGVSLLPSVEQIQPEDWVILELSSFQLHALNRLQVSPQIAVITNFSPNHLDWHQTLEHYRQSKQNILLWQKSDDFTVINQDDPELRNWRSNGQVCTFGSNPAREPDLLIQDESFVFPEFDLKIEQKLAVPGWHNQFNAAAAILATQAAGIDLGKILSGLDSFQGLPHRLQYLGEYQGRRFYNDSLATTPESAICALEAFEAGQLIVLAGGSDKKVDLAPFSRMLLTRTKAVSLMGTTGPVLHTMMQYIRDQERPEAESIISPPHVEFENAFNWAVQQSSPGDVILLSPGCASFGWFTSFAERGARFEQAFQELVASGDL